MEWEKPLMNSSQKKFFFTLLSLLIWTFGTKKEALSAPLKTTSLAKSELCPMPRPKGSKLYSAQDPRVLKHLSDRSRLLRTLTEHCSIDHRNTFPKTSQYGTSFCHVHAFAELWNSYFPEAIHVDTATLSLQAWLNHMGQDLATILDAEVTKMLYISQTFPTFLSMGEPMLLELQRIAQAGRLEDDLALIQRYGFVPLSRQNWLTDADVFELSLQYRDIHLRLFEKGPELNKQDVLEFMGPFYEDILQLAWPSVTSRIGLDAAHSATSDLARRYQIMSFPFNHQDTHRSQARFIERLKQQPLAVALTNHAVVVSGYDSSKRIFWIRDSSEYEVAYYPIDEADLFKQLENYFMIKPKNS